MELVTETKTEQKVVTVSQLTSSIKGLLENGIGSVVVRGEISNWRPAASGHTYFSLKDADATISAAFFKGAAMKARNLNLKDGAEVLCRGRISVYAPRGSYQIIVESIELVGAGSLQAQFEALKKKLFAEGLFDSARKRPLPLMPARIVVITSPTGAAIRDVLSVLKRRFAGVNVLLIPALVQGDGAPKELIRALRQANEFALGDVILLTRGGGSLEDLWCFNNEELAREIFQSKIPVVSAVGHEIDFTIADFVADYRAPTPSAAAEILVKEQKLLAESVHDFRLRIIKSMKSELAQSRLRLREAVAKLRNPRDRINELRLRFDDWAERLALGMGKCLDKKAERLKRMESMLTALSPLQVLDRGYAIAFDTNGKALRSRAALKPGTDFRLQLADGSVEAQTKP